jgi:predicted PurR-regulated permease PerM
MIPRMAGEHVVGFRGRTILKTIGIVVAVALLLWLIWQSRGVITWVLIAAFLAMAVNPLVDRLQRRVGMARGWAAAVVYLAVLAAIAAIGFSFVPTLVNQVNDFADALPGYVKDLTAGRGRLGFLETKYHIVDRVKEQVSAGGAGKVLGLSGTALTITKSIFSTVAAVVTIAFLTFFMILEGPKWMERIYGLLPEESQPRWRRVGNDIYRTVGGYVSGNLLISLIAGLASFAVLYALSVPYAVALALIVAVLDLIPLAGATIAAIVVCTVGFLHSTTAGIVLVIFFVIYQQLENHFLQPVIYGRTVQLSPLAVLVSVLVGAELAGVLGALGAIPVAGAIQVVIVDARGQRVARRAAAAGGGPSSPPLTGRPAPPGVDAPPDGAGAGAS